MAKKVSTSIPQKGMNRDRSSHFLSEQEYPISINSNIQDNDGETFNLTTEQSNLLAVRFEEGFKVIGKKEDLNSDSTYFFLVNPETNTSEIGVVNSHANIDLEGDVIQQCKNCEYNVELADPLEEQTQTPHQTYVSLLTDDCNGCLNFSINHPIKKIEIKEEKCGKVMYFTDGINPPRNIVLSDIERYKTITERDDCSEDITVETDPEERVVYTCPEGYVYDAIANVCVRNYTESACPEGYSYNSNTGLCEEDPTIIDACPAGYTYNSSTGMCEGDDVVCIADVAIVLAYNNVFGGGSTTRQQEMEDMAVSLISNISTQLSQDRYRVSIIKTGVDGDVSVITPLTNNISTINSAITSSYSDPTENHPDFIESYCTANTQLISGRPEAKKNVIVIGYNYTQNYDGGCLGCASAGSGERPTTIKCITDQMKSNGIKSILVDTYAGSSVGHGSMGFELGGNPDNPDLGSHSTPSSSSDVNSWWGFATYRADSTDAALPTPNEIAPWVADAIECEGDQDIIPNQCGSCDNNNDGTCTCTNAISPSCDVGCVRSGGICNCTEEITPTEETELVCNLGTLNETTGKCEYTYTVENVCGCEVEVPTCIDCDKLRMFPLHEPIVFSATEVVLGGRLKLGAYEAFAAYCDVYGNEITEYESKTDIVRIFDNNNTILEQSQLADNTNFAIRFEVSDIDTKYEYYKIVIAQTASLDGSTRYFEEGIHRTTDTEILYTTEIDKKEISINELYTTYPSILTWEGLTSSNKSLIGYGLEYEKEWNLQPVINLLGTLLKWQTGITTEEHYSQPIHETGYHRDEVQPFAIRFITNTGYKTPRYPLIARPSLAYEVENAEQNNDYIAFQNIGNTCTTYPRTKVWEYYNTAEEEGQCSFEDINTNTIIEPTSKVCIVENAVESGPGVVVIQDVEQFTNLSNFIRRILSEGSCPSSIYPFCEDINNAPDVNCDPQFENCNSPSIEEEYFQVNTITGEEIEEVPAEFPREYDRVKTASTCQLVETDSDGTPVRDLDFMEDYLLTASGCSDVSWPGDVFAYVRSIIFGNTSPRTSERLQLIRDMSQAIVGGNIIDYVGGYELDHVIYEEFEVSCTKTETLDIPIRKSDNDITWSNTRFTTNIHRNSIWFEVNLDDVEINDRNQKVFVLEVSKGLKDKGNEKDSLSTDSFRISIFDNKLGGEAKACKFFYSRDGEQIKITYDVDADAGQNNINFEDAEGTLNEDNRIDTNSLYIAIDGAIWSCDNAPTPTGDIYLGFGSEVCMAVGIQPEIINQLNVSYDEIQFDKVQKWVAECTYEIPIIDECKVQPYKYGRFSYWESIIDYPKNEELYDSSSIIMSPGDLPEVVREDFELYYVQGLDIEGNYVWKTDDLGVPLVNFMCRPIRHFKFPDNKVAPFMWDNQQAPFSESLVFPLGVTISESAINSFLDIAVNNNVITQQQRDSITHYEILRGDRVIDKSIVAKGVLYDMYTYKEENRDIQYSNYPYNDLGDDLLHYTSESRSTLIPHPHDSLGNNSWTFHSPITEYNRTNIPSEIKIDGYLFGKSRGHFVDVENHPKWVILGDDAFRTASTLATAEVLAEAAIAIAQSAEVWRFQFGVSNSSNPVGIGLNVAVAATQVFSSLEYKYGRYKYQWLETFTNMGQPENFAYYFTSEGFYNYIRPIQEIGEILRPITIAKYMKPGRFYFTNEYEGKRVEVNNTGREDSVYINVPEDYPITYPQEYISYDNSNIDKSGSSRTYASQSLGCSNGKSAELVRNIASPYVALKNYVPDQYGRIDSVKWVTTSFIGNLENPDDTCKPIYGGDVFITRHTLKRKMPMFSLDAMNVPSLTPFNYKFYSSVAEPVYYCNYEVTDGINLDRGFPNRRSDYFFDCDTGSSGFYVEPPSKFYLYYYGIPNFLVESEINTNFRYGGSDPKDNFYPNVGDYVEWTQESNVSIRDKEKFLYNRTYSKIPHGIIDRGLPETYNQEEWDCRFDKPNGFMWSQPDRSENDVTDPWLVYKPLNVEEFDTRYGGLRDMRGIESEMVLARFDNQTAIFNSVDSLIDDGQTPETQTLGTGMRRRPVTFTDTNLGYLGTQSYQMVSCEYGHFYCDAMRGQIFKVNPAGKGFEEISKYSGGQLNGMYNWFKRNLPFKILDTRITNYEEIDIDNAFKDVGITMTWDSRYDRVIITKKDYKPKENICYIDGKYYKTTGYQDVIDQYIQDGWSYAGIENCQLKFTREVTSITESTDIHVFYDNSGSMTAEQLESTDIAVDAWYNSLTTILPGYSGNLYKYTGNANQENWLAQLERLENSSSINGYEGDVTGKDIIIISLINESQNDYHNNLIINNTNVLSDYINTTQADTYLEDYCTYLSIVSKTRSFKGILYPIINRGGSKVLIVQTLAALYGDVLTTQEFNNLPQNPAFTDEEWDVDVRRILTTGINVYEDNFTGCEGLSSYIGLNNADYLAQINRSSANQEGFLTIDDFVGTTNMGIYVGIPGQFLTLYNVAFNTDIETTLIDFVNQHAATILTATGSTVTSSGNTLNFTQMAPENTEYPMVDYTGVTIVSSPPLVSEEQFAEDINELLNVGGEEVETETTYEPLEEINLIDDTYFEDCSWTIAYHVPSQMWLSYYDYKPNYYVSHNDYFQSGINYSNNDNNLGLWSHLLTNKSYLVFYGDKYSWTVEAMFKNEFRDKAFDNLQVRSEFRRYQDENNFAVNRDVLFDKIWIHNNTANSGELRLVPQKTLAQNRKYPITNSSYQEILTSRKEDRWNINYFFDRVISNTNNIPIWNWDVNKIHKDINNQAVSFKGKKVLSRMEGEWFKVTLEYNKDSRYRGVFKWLTATEDNEI